MSLKINMEGLITKDHLNSLLALIGETGCGGDLNYDPDFEDVKLEISKLQNMDYDFIEEKSYSILKNKSKDIRVFSYLALCYLKKKKWSYFCNVFEALAQLSKEKFDLLFPLRLNGKMLAFMWLEESRFSGELKAATVSDDAHEQMKRLISALDILKEQLKQKFTDKLTFPSNLYSFAQKWKKLTEGNRVVVSQPDKSEIKEVNSTDTAQNIRGIEPNIDTKISVKAALDSIRKWAMFLIEQKPQSAVGYRLIRTARWGNIEILPDSLENVTRIEPPAMERRAFLVSLIEKRDFKTALVNAEKFFSSGNTLYWLDLQRISATAAGCLGNAFVEVRDAIIFETAVFLKKFPVLRDYKFIDETPFSSFETSAWLDNQVVSLFETNREIVKVNKEGSTDNGEVHSIISSSNIEEDLELLVKGINQSSNELDNFKRRLSVVSCMLATQRLDIALFMLESLYEVAESYHLARWSPSLVMDLLNLMVRTYDEMAKDKSGIRQSLLIQKRDNMLKKMCYLDPIAAFNYQPINER